MSKSFKFDVIIGKEDLCNRQEEIKRIQSIINRKGRLVLYSVRRMGKTSLAKICSEMRQQEDPESFHIYIDLNETNSLGEVAQRFHVHSELALNKQFPLQKVKNFLNDLLSRLKVNLSSGIELSLEKMAVQQPESYLLQLFQKLAEISKKNETVLIVDEFQAIAGQNEAQAFLRREFQQLSHLSIILMGSNQRLLYNIFNDKKLPFFSFGEDLELKKISVKDYLPYLNERFATSDLSIEEETAQYMLNAMNNIPNYINELGAWIVDHLSNAELTNVHIDNAFESAVESKQGRYTSALYAYSVIEKKFIKAIARLGNVKNYSGKPMQEFTQLPSSELVRVKKTLEDCPLLSLDTENRLFIIDPFLKKFLLAMP
jgi:uncharacterized protein